MQPPVEGSAEQLVRRNVARIGEHVYTCGCHEGAAGLTADHLWFRLQNLVDPGIGKESITWQDVQRDGSLTPSAPHKPVGGVPALAAIGPKPTEIHWFAVCRACLDGAGGNPSIIAPRRHYELSDQPVPEFS